MSSQQWTCTPGVYSNPSTFSPNGATFTLAPGTYTFSQGLNVLANGNSIVEQGNGGVFFYVPNGPVALGTPNATHPGRQLTSHSPPRPQALMTASFSTRHHPTRIRSSFGPITSAQSRKLPLRSDRSHWGFDVHRCQQQPNHDWIDRCYLTDLEFIRSERLHAQSTMPSGHHRVMRS